MPDWVPEGEDYSGTVDGKTFLANSEDGVYLMVTIPLDQPLPRPAEILFEDGKPLSPTEPRMEKTIRALVELGAYRLNLSSWEPPCVSIKVPLNKHMPLAKAEDIARLLLDLEFYARKPL